MKLYAAPMEGITRYCYRNAHAKYFGGIDAYYAPFIVSRQVDSLKSRELSDLLPENNKSLTLIPQVMANKAEAFLASATLLSKLGYQEVNLNLGCPSKTVVTKGLAAGFLREPEALDAFLEEIFARSPVKISIKTRIGITAPEEFERLLEIYHKYPLTELIVHARTADQMYQGKPDEAAFAKAYQEEKIPLCYNGDLFTELEVKSLCDRYPKLSAAMLGRGLIANPALPAYLKGHSAFPIETYQAFAKEIAESYQTIYSGDKDVLYKMKEFWTFFGKSFVSIEKPLKRIKKATKLSEYEAAVNDVFQNYELKR